MVMGVLGALGGVATALALRRPVYLLLCLVALVPVVDGLWARRGRRRSVLVSVLLDITAAGAGLAFFHSGQGALMLMAVYFTVITVGLVDHRERMIVGGYGVLAIVAVVVVTETTSPPFSHAVDRLVFVGAGGLALAAVVVLGSAMDRLIERDRATLASLDERVRYEHAVVLCSRALLRGDAGITEALEALREATGAHHVFVDVNEIHSRLGLCARLTHEVLAPGHRNRDTADLVRDPESDEEIPYLLPYDILPTSYAGLSRGVPAVVEPRLLPPGPERDLYLDAGVETELNLPILVDGEWFGSLGFGHFDEPYEWGTREIEFLRTAADMFGAFFERSRDRERLVASIAARDELIASVSHELRTPLSVVIGLASELRDRGDAFSDEERRQLVELIAAQSGEMGELISDLLVAAADGRFDLVVAPEIVVVGELVRQVVEGSVAFGGRDVEIVDDGAKAWADPVRFRQIVRNLLANARRYGGPHVAVRILARDDTTVVEVVDDGPGIPEGRAEEAFRAYGRAHRRSTQTESMGLGLAVCRKLAVAMGGGLVYERRDDLTVFRLSMPGVEG